MYKTNEAKLISTFNNINYYVQESENNPGGRKFGILAISTVDSEDREFAENLFFTHAEAEACCKWLAKNEVYPVTLCEVLENVYHA